MRALGVLSVLLAVSGWHGATAGSIFKWVDETGQVIYSSTPPPRGVQAEHVEPPPQPTDEDVRDARARTERAQTLARELETERLVKEAEAAEAARRRALEAPPPPVVVESPVYVPQPVYYPPVSAPPPRRPRHGKPGRTTERRATPPDLIRRQAAPARRGG